VFTIMFEVMLKFSWNKSNCSTMATTTTSTLHNLF